MKDVALYKHESSQTHSTTVTRAVYLLCLDSASRCQDDDARLTTIESLINSRMVHQGLITLLLSSSPTFDMDETPGSMLRSPILDITLQVVDGLLTGPFTDGPGER